MSNFSPDLQEALWWRSSQPHEPPGANNHRQAWPSNPYHHHDRGLGLNLNQRGEDDESSGVEEQVVDEMNATNYAGEQEVPELDKELLFEKPLTPSDVGKLNRLVIPKQHAEKCFPLGGESGDKGLLLSFEDESGRCWRFRYSYWSSSQSYVLTKGWSKYVKEKRLDAGDVILFERHRVDMDRLFIGWRRRGEEAVPLAQPRGWTVTAATYPTKRGSCHSYPAHHPGHDPHSGSAAQNRTAVTGNSRTLRLFGVNMECWLDKSEPSMPDGSSLSSLGLGHQPMYSQTSHQMGITFTQDANHRHIRDRRG